MDNSVYALSITLGNIAKIFGDLFIGTLGEIEVRPLVIIDVIPHNLMGFCLEHLG